MAIIALIVSVVVGFFSVYEYLEYRFMYSVPKARLAASDPVLATFFAAVGVIISALNHRIVGIASVLSRQLSQKR